MKSYTDLEQSKKLAEILPLESVDAFYIIGKEPVDIVPIYGLITHQHLREQMAYKRATPCWSLASLIDILPRFIEFKGDKYYLRFMKEYVEYANDEVSITGRCLHTTSNDNLVDACYQMILKLHESNLL